jgi:tetratricopeptide (TPR) repeat protein
LAGALSRLGEHDTALETVKDGLKILEETGHRQLEAEFHRLKGIALFGLKRMEEGENALETALRVSRKQPGKGL